jgi:FMN phosphatase YigB (HAD superfamily)
MGIVRTLSKTLVNVFGPNRTTTPLVFITLDALGTIYKFRQPVATQYLKIARDCGVDAQVDEAKLSKAFRVAFKRANEEAPNYGKSSPGVESPKEWWSTVVNQAFGEVIPGGASAVPPEVSETLYDHFSSSAAYEPFDDVRPFLDSIASLKQRFVDEAGPLILTGVVTNSDPRVRSVMTDMGFRVGISSIPDYEQVKKHAMERFRASIEAETNMQSVFFNTYNRRNDFDMLVTSYHADAEKPDEAMWQRAWRLATPNVVSRSEQAAHARISSSSTPGMNFSNITAAARAGLQYQVQPANALCIHIGDDYEKDYIGADMAGWNALHLAREGAGHRDLPEAVQVVNSLDEAAMVVNLMAQEFINEAMKENDNET